MLAFHYLFGFPVFCQNEFGSSGSSQCWNYKCSFSVLWLIFNYILVDHMDLFGVKRSYVSTGIRTLIEIARFPSQAEFELSGDIFIRKVSQTQGKPENVRDNE